MKSKESGCSESTAEVSAMEVEAAPTAQQHSGFLRNFFQALFLFFGVTNILFSFIMVVLLFSTEDSDSGNFWTENSFPPLSMVLSRNDVVYVPAFSLDSCTANRSTSEPLLPATLTFHVFTPSDARGVTRQIQVAFVANALTLIFSFLVLNVFRQGFAKEMEEEPRSDNVDEQERVAARQPTKLLITLLSLAFGVTLLIGLLSMVLSNGHEGIVSFTPLSNASGSISTAIDSVTEFDRNVYWSMTVLNMNRCQVGQSFDVSLCQTVCQQCEPVVQVISSRASCDGNEHKIHFSAVVGNDLNDPYWSALQHFGFFSFLMKIRIATFVTPTVIWTACLGLTLTEFFMGERLKFAENQDS